MGMDLSVHVGVYVEIRAKSLREKAIFLSCPIHGEVHSTMLYCPRCGGKVHEVETTIEHPATLYSLLPEDEYEDVLYNASGESNNSVIFAVGNKAGDESSIHVDLAGEDSATEITPEMIAASIVAFNADYADVLAVLRERATSVDVKFGVLTWWS